MEVNPEPERLSPLHNQHQTMKANLHLWDGWLVPDDYSSSEEETAALRDHVGLGDFSNRGKLLLKGTGNEEIIRAIFGESPANPGDVLVSESKHLLAAKLTIDEFLVLIIPGFEKELASSLKAEITSQNILVSVIDQTSGLAGLLISGPKSTGVMNKLSALDFSPTEFPNLHVAQSSFAKVRTIIIRNDRGDSPTFELYADRSYADYLWTAVLDAGKEFDIQPVGWKAIVFGISKGQI